MGVEPCFCVNNRKGAFIVGFVKIGLSAVCLLSLFILYLVHSNSNKDNYSTEGCQILVDMFRTIKNKDSNYEFCGFIESLLIVLFFTMISEVVASICILFGAKHYNVIYLYVFIGIVVLTSFCYFIMISVGSSKVKNVYFLIFFVFTNIYCSFVCIYYLYDLKTGAYDVPNNNNNEQHPAEERRRRSSQAPRQEYNEYYQPPQYDQPPPQPVYYPQPQIREREYQDQDQE